MTGYRRFVAYIYEYQKGKKGTNCGFVRVEKRGELYRMEFRIRCVGLLPEIRCRVYGFVRNKGLMDSTLLGECETQKDGLEYILEADGEKMQGRAVVPDNLAGLILLTENGGFLGTEWDDHPIRPENFHPLEKKIEKQEKISDIEENTDTEKDSDRNISDEKSSEPEIKSSEPEIKSSGSEVHVQSVEIPSISRAEAEAEPKDTEPEAKAEPEPEAKAEPEPEAETEPEPRPISLPGTPYEAFGDGEMTECRKINLDDLRTFGRKFCMLRNNRFIQYGYCNFGHLLTGRNRSGQYILGIPGCYDQQERFMASMFGFPYFKDSHQIRVPRGRGGYWYRLINTADFH